jgi:hypothetical protein
MGVAGVSIIWTWRCREAIEPAKVACVAVARKLVTLLNAMVRDSTTWREAID